jgi:Kef-type K+ transport system membrane component KefB
MRKVFLYSFLLTIGLSFSWLLNGRYQAVAMLLAMFCLSYIMIRIGFGFEVTRAQPQKYFWDYVVSTTTTVLPWLFCTLYFVLVMAPTDLVRSRDMWWEAAVLGRFAAPTSVGLLFPMLAAAGLSATWLYKKARILAIFDDLETTLLFVPLKFFVLSQNIKLVVLVFVIFGLLWAAWKYVRFLRLPATCPWLLFYSAIVVTITEIIRLGSKAIDDTLPVQLEVLVISFILGCMLARAPSEDLAAAEAQRSPTRGLESPREERAAMIVSACFMILVGLSLPHSAATESKRTREDTLMANKYVGVSPEVLAQKEHFPGRGMIALHVLIITALSNIGKMGPDLCYRKEASRRERLALAIGMFPRGEVGASMLVVSVSYGIAGPALTVAVVSLALNLLCSGFFVLIIKRLITPPQGGLKRAGLAAVQVNPP